MAKNELEYTHFGTSGLFEGKYSDIRDDFPEEVVRKIHPKSQGLTLQRERTGLSLLRLDPYCGSSRWLNSIRGRIYSVPCPQALSHIDESQFINSKAQIY